MEDNHEFDFAVSYAGPDQPFVTEVVSALRARGLTVFHAPDEQADMIGRNLLDYLHTVYLSKARYCLLFVSKHYAERKWTNKVERPAAQERALEQDERYIIPIRLDDTRITGLSGNTLDIRDSTPKRIADLCVAVMLRDKEPAAFTPYTHKSSRLVLRVVSLVEFDVEMLQQSFKQFAGWAVSNAHMIPVELRLPSFLVETISDYSRILESETFKNIDPATRQQFTRLVATVQHDFGAELLRVPSCVLVASQPSGASTLTLTENAIELIRRYVLSKVIALARCLVTWQLKGFPGVPWARKFADCDKLWTPSLMGGLPWLCRSEGTEKHLWFNSDITGWGNGVSFPHVRIYRPSVLISRRDSAPPTADEIHRFITPQLIEKELEGRMPRLLHSALHYPERMRVTYRNEVVIECHHFREVILSNYNWTEALPAIEAMRDEILQSAHGSREAICDALSLMSAADFAIGDHEEVLLEAQRELWERLRMHDSKNARRKSDGEAAQ